MFIIYKMNSSNIIKSKLPNRLLYDKIKSVISDKKISILNSIQLLTLLIEEVEKFDNMYGNEKKQYVINTLEEIAKGDDGILGTEDDIIPTYIYESLKILIESNLISDIIDNMINIYNKKSKSSNFCCI